MFSIFFCYFSAAIPTARAGKTVSMICWGRSSKAPKISREAFLDKSVPTQMPVVFYVFRSFWAPFGILHPLGDLPEKCHFGGFLLHLWLWLLCAIPHMYVLSSRLSWLLRFTSFSSLLRLYPSCSLFFVLLVSLVCFSLCLSLSLSLAWTVGDPPHKSTTTDDDRR